jgi:hypothetical protein
MGNSGPCVDHEWQGVILDAKRSHEPAVALWSAPAERSGDGAFSLARQRALPGSPRVDRIPRQSGVALRLPPHSKTL